LGLQAGSPLTGHVERLGRHQRITTFDDTPKERIEDSRRGTIHREGGAVRLSEEQIGEALASGDLPGWRLGRKQIFKNFKFPTFMEAVAFINRVADQAEAANHHPDLENHYNRVRIGLQTWSENAVTEKDLALARAIESVVQVSLDQ
jgi:4a-hydroxytetrahydrobiopterin dehydratase